MGFSESNLCGLGAGKPHIANFPAVFVESQPKKAKFIWLKPVLLLHSTLTGSFVLEYSGTVRSGNLI